MNEKELVRYLANVILTGSADGKMTDTEGKALEYIIGEIGAGDKHVGEALAKINGGYNKPVETGRYSDGIRNLEDMVLISLADRALPDPEKTIIREFAQELQLTQAQLNRIMTESQRRVKRLDGRITCPHCGREAAAESRFCPHCGVDLKNTSEE